MSWIEKRRARNCIDPLKIQHGLYLSKIHIKVFNLTVKTTNKAWDIQTKKLEFDLLGVGADLKDIKMVKKLLDEKENNIQILKKKLNISDA